MSTTTAPATELALLKPSQLSAHPKNIRKDVGDLTSLTDSIAAQGIQQPLVVAPNGKPDKYILIAGHRRLAAAKDLNLRTVPCIIDHTRTDEADQIAAMLAENIERQDLTAVEESDGVALLLDLNLNQKQIASRTGMPAARVRNRIKVAKLSDEMKARLTEHEVTLADAVFIADHAANPADLAELEAALGTNNWAVAKQKQLDRVMERKRVASIRKDAEAAGIEIITNWEKRREVNAAAAEKLGVPAVETDRFEYIWPPAPEVLEVAQRDDTVAYLHMADSRTLWVEGKTVSEALVVIAVAAPTGSAAPAAPANDGPASSAAGTGADGATDSGSDDRASGTATGEGTGTASSVSHEPTEEQRAAEELRTACEAAAKVRRQFIRDLVAAGDPSKALRATGTAAQYAALINEAEWYDAARYLPVPDDVTREERTDLVREWFTDSTRSTASVLLAMLWASVFYYPERVLAREDTHYDYFAANDLELVIAYSEMLADVGHVLSDAELAVVAAVQAALDKESGDEK
ncbi:ParB-like nuclease domain protein [Gordonia phage DirtyBoi]|nr:ParB-like nuclease domain protein [Gordonia phage DirtyBoi]